MAPPQLIGLPADIKRNVFDSLLTERYGEKLTPSPSLCRRLSSIWRASNF
jgi:hypothetical protein